MKNKSTCEICGRDRKIGNHTECSRRRQMQFAHENANRKSTKATRKGMRRLAGHLAEK